ncbi:hypothetical protein [Nesterenkonia pannonica]|uniref:hypothetical protein n=1 Tax=Nesterenkonia pannonica TaxID=1548602 RepID=UPI00216469F6|nr:hypothetical protein [Nesterenkonia pannonica]
MAACWSPWPVGGSTSSCPTPVRHHPRTGAPDEELYTYRDGGREGDTLMAELVSGLPAVLAPAGTAQMLGNWEILEEDAMARPRAWAEDSGLSAWFIQRDAQTPPSTQRCGSGRPARSGTSPSTAAATPPTCVTLRRAECAASASG